jgi:DNA modification methylase
MVNRLILGDNLEILKTMAGESVDLIYLDPPFFSNRNYEVIWGDAGEVRSFQDRWAGGIDHYIAWLKERVEEMHRILKPAGSIFLHCDWHANAYIRCEILDRIFGDNNFRNEIIWQRTRNPKGSQFEKRNLGIATDTIFWYSKTENYYFNEEAAREQLQNSELAKKYPDFDERGRYYSGPVIRGASMGERPNLVYEYKGFTPEIYGWRMTREKLIKLDMAGDLGWSSNGKPFRKLRPENDKGNPIYNFWNDINRLYSGSPENIGYPAQKPEKLLKRIIIMASSEGDTVLDPFMGGGTTIAVADKLNRRWIGIDQSIQAVKVTEFRLDKQRDLFSAPFTVQLHKYDHDTLRYKNAFEFAKKPVISVEINELSRDAKGVREIEFIASGQSEAGIEFYSWDFEYNAEKGFRASVIIDKHGKQQHKLKAGIHHIAVKVVDNDGLESIEVIKLKVNGTVESEN